MNRISIDGKSGLGEMYEAIERGEYGPTEYSKFSEDLHRAYGVESNPKRGKLFVIAFHKGNMNGLAGILKVYDELVCLIR